MRRLIPLLVFFLACSNDATSDDATSTSASAPETTISSTTTTTEPPPPCPPAPYELAHLPVAVEPAESGDTVDEPDDLTSMGGTHVRIWVSSDDETAIALIRGALPPRQFPAERGEVDIAGSRGVAGPYPDGRWVVAWYNEPGDRCDQYTMVFYPPVSPDEVEQTLSGMTRLPG